MEKPPTMTEEQMAEYLHLAHAVQTGVAYEQQIDPTDGTPKHLRVGINLLRSDQAAIAELLMEKGVFTREEYYESILKWMRKEVETYEKSLSAHYGKTIKLG